MPSEEPISRVVDSRSTHGRHQRPRERLLHKVEVTLFQPGQPVVWTYRSQLPPRQIQLVEAEVVHAGPVRARIRLRDTKGHILLRWVKPERLRHKQTNEAVQLYPARLTSQ